MLGSLELLVILALFVAVPVLLWVALRSRYRHVAEQSAAAHEENMRRLDEIAAELSSIRTQLAALERVLTQVE